jgi:hypothetical protein
VEEVSTNKRSRAPFGSVASRSSFLATQHKNQTRIYDTLLLYVRYIHTHTHTHNAFFDNVHGQAHHSS